MSSVNFAQDSVHHTGAGSPYRAGWARGASGTLLYTRGGLARGWSNPPSPLSINSSAAVITHRSSRLVHHRHSLLCPTPWTFKRAAVSCLFVPLQHTWAHMPHLVSRGSHGLRPCPWSDQLRVRSQRKQRIAQSLCSPLEDCVTRECECGSCASWLVSLEACSIGTGRRVEVVWNEGEDLQARLVVCPCFERDSRESWRWEVADTAIWYCATQDGDVYPNMVLRAHQR